MEGVRKNNVGQVPTRKVAVFATNCDKVMRSRDWVEFIKKAGQKKEVLHLPRVSAFYQPKNSDTGAHPLPHFSKELTVPALVVEVS